MGTERKFKLGRPSVSSSAIAAGGFWAKLVRYTSQSGRWLEMPLNDSFSQFARQLTTLRNQS